MRRRSFLGSILALAAAPAIVRADSLMRVVPWDTEVIRYPYVGMDLGAGDFTTVTYIARAPFNGPVIIEPATPEQVRWLAQHGQTYGQAIPLHRMPAGADGIQGRDEGAVGMMVGDTFVII